MEHGHSLKRQVAELVQRRVDVIDAASGEAGYLSDD